MVARIEELTPELEATLAPHAQEWIARGLRAGVMTDAEWEDMQDAIRAAYRLSGLAEPRTILRAPSPLAGTLTMRELQRQKAERGERSHTIWPIGGQWHSASVAWRDWLIRQGGVELSADLRERHDVWVRMTVAGDLWLDDDAVIVSERPIIEPRRMRVGPDGWASHVLHCADGPAVQWADGWTVHAWRGVVVPADLIEGDGWDVTRILREPNAEIRRCAIERIGWPQFVANAGLTQVGDACPDPGNPGQELTLWDVPDDVWGGDEPVRVLLCTNGSDERDGTRRQFGLTVPATVSTPLEAAAWTYDGDDSPVPVTAETYAALAVRR